MSESRIVLITGANTGLGLEIVRALVKSPERNRIILACRTPASGEKAAAQILSGTPTTESTIEVEQCDLESDESLELLKRRIEERHGRLDVLVNNAGVNLDRELTSGRLSIREAFNKTWNINVTGTHLLTTLLIPLLKKSYDARLLFMTSGTSSMTETDVEKVPHLARINGLMPVGWPKDHGINPITIYRSSKAGLNMLMREWNRWVANDGIKVWAVSPGFLATGLSNIGREQLLKIGAQEPHVGGEFVRDVINGKRDADVGLIVRQLGSPIQPY
jgi:NAD(P)-dependent dehydrogenase (short-subunit alcohol dehydrogenase family)